MSYALSGFEWPSTSAAGAMRFWHGWDRVRRLGAMLVSQGTASAPLDDTLRVDVEQTNAGLAIAEPERSSAAIAELRRVSGFTWEQLGRLFGVSRRSIHFWASGKAMTAEHEEHLYRLLATIRVVDRGSASANRAELLTVREDGNIPFDLLAAGRYEEVISLVGAGGTQPQVPLLQLSDAAKAVRLPPPPAELVGALQDRIYRKTERARAVKSVRVRSARRDRV